MYHQYKPIKYSRLRKFRQTSGITVTEAARIIRTRSLRRYLRIELGKATPTTIQVERLAGRLGINSHELFVPSDRSLLLNMLKNERRRLLDQIGAIDLIFELDKRPRAEVM